MERLFNKVRTSRFFNRLLHVMNIIPGMGMLCIKIMYSWFEKHPTEGMRSSVKYFEEHRDDIVRLENLLADDKSKQVWRQMIEFRKTMNYKIHPGMEPEQYFVDDIIRLNEEEVFIDCGGYDGKTSLDFINKVNGKFRNIVIFEPDSGCHPMIRKNVPIDRRIQIIPKGVWDMETDLSFVSSGDSASHVAGAAEKVQGIETISVIPIDGCDECKDATFIKMDLEGAEQNALRGSKETIKKNKPKLAICIYHSDEDMVKIIDYIHELVPEYKLYVRHHSTSQMETVVYAVL